MRKRVVQAILGAAALVVGMLGTTAVANAVTGDTVSVACGDVYGGSGLIAQIIEANSEGGLTTILLAPSCVYVLTSQYDSTGSGLPNVTGDILLSGRFTTIARGTEAPGFRIISVIDSGDLTTQGIRFTNGSQDDGGCLLMTDQATLTVRHGEIDHCEAAFGGGIANEDFVDGPLTITGVLIAYNSAEEGGGIANSETDFMAIQGSWMKLNTAGAGGAIWNEGDAVLSNTAVYQNTADFGGGVDEDGGSMTLVMTWIAGNTPTNCEPTLTVVGCYG